MLTEGTLPLRPGSEPTKGPFSTPQLYKPDEVGTSLEISGTILDEWERKKDTYISFLKVVENIIKSILPRDQFPISSVTSRPKTSKSLADKLSRKSYNRLEQITDLVGVRIIAQYEDAVDRIAQAVGREFSVVKSKSVDKRKELSSGQFGYLSLHLIVGLNSVRSSLTEHLAFNDLLLEIQIRSILQHAWAEIEHETVYKNFNRAAIPPAAKRTLARIASLLELADQQFVSFRDSIERDRDLLTLRAGALAELIPEFTLCFEGSTVPRSDQPQTLVLGLSGVVAQGVLGQGQCSVLAILDGISGSRPAEPTMGQPVETRWNCVRFVNAIPSHVITSRSCAVTISNLRVSTSHLGLNAPLTAKLWIERGEDQSPALIVDTTPLAQCLGSLECDTQSLIDLPLPWDFAKVVEHYKDAVHMEIVFREGFSGAFTTQAQESTALDLASNGTRFLVSVHHPRSLTAFATSGEITGESARVRLTQSDVNGGGRFTRLPLVRKVHHCGAELGLCGSSTSFGLGRTCFAWEWICQEKATVRRHFSVGLHFSRAVGTTHEDEGKVTITIGLAPVSSAVGGTGSAPSFTIEPFFEDLGTLTLPCGSPSP